MLHKATCPPTKHDENDFRQYTVANYLRYPIKCLITKASVLEFMFAAR